MSWWAAEPETLSVAEDGTPRLQMDLPAFNHGAVLHVLTGAFGDETASHRRATVWEPPMVTVTKPSTACVPNAFTSALMPDEGG